MRHNQEFVQYIKAKVLECLDFTEDIEDQVILGNITEVLVQAAGEKYYTLDELGYYCKIVYNGLRRLDILQELLEDDSISEIMVNGPDFIFIEKNGAILRYDGKFESREKLEDVIQKIVSKSNRTVNEANPIVDSRLEDGSRVNVVLNPVAQNGPILTIRKFPSTAITMKKLIELGSITEEAASFLEKLVIAKYNIFISGGTGSGKTTFLNALSNYIPSDERIITIEDSTELQIKKIPNLVTLEARNANVEGTNAITIRDLIKASLRMRPDRIVIGEVRDAAAIDMLAALNTGHDGSLSTGHANSPGDMLSRLETLVLMGMDIPLLAVRRQIASALDIIVHLGRLRDKSRRVLEIVEVLGMVDGEIKYIPLYSFKELGEDQGRVIGCLQKSEYELQAVQKLERAGVML